MWTKIDRRAMQTSVSGNLNLKIVIEFSYRYLLKKPYVDLGSARS